MSIPFYLAMNDEEIRTCTSLPPFIARTGLCFSNHTPELSGTELPKFPQNTRLLLVLDDHIPWEGHDLASVCQEAALLLRDSNANGLLLDFERQPRSDTVKLASALQQVCHAMDKAIGLPPAYGVQPGSASFCSCPPWVSCAPGKDHPLWMEGVLSAWNLIIGPEGAVCEAASPIYFNEAASETPTSEGCHSHREREQIHVTLSDTHQGLLDRAEQLGAERIIGPYSQWQMV